MYYEDARQVLVHQTNKQCTRCIDCLNFVFCDTFRRVTDDGKNEASFHFAAGIQQAGAAKEDN